MSSLVSAIGQYLSPSKPDLDSEKMVDVDAKNGDPEGKRVITNQVKSISSADKIIGISSADDKTAEPEVKKLPENTDKKHKKTKSLQKEEATEGATEGNNCGMCKKSFVKNKSMKVAICGICETNYCHTCAEFTPHMCATVLDRSDVLWACYSCRPRLENFKLATPLEQETPTSDEIVLEGKIVMERFDSLREEINGLKGQVNNALGGINKFSQDISLHMREIMNETLFGDDYPEFDPTISHKQAKLLAKEQNKSPPPTLNSVLKSTVNEQKKEDKKEDSAKAQARCNIIIYNLEEPTENDGVKRKEITDNKIDELLNFLEVSEINPVKTHRLGKFKSQNEEGGNPKPRPLKVILNNIDEALKIVNNCKKLKNAPSELKKLSVSHDLTNEERSCIREEVKKAKELTMKSPNLDYKVVGPPWQPRIQSYKRRAASGEN